MMKTLQYITLFTSLLLALLSLSTTGVVEAVDEQRFLQALLREELDETNVRPDGTVLNHAANLAVASPSVAELTGSAWNINVASSYARLASAAYCAPLAVEGSRTRLNTWSCQQCADSGLKLTEVAPFKIALSDMYGFVGYNGASNQVFLVWTGSRSLVNWIYNLDATFVPFDGVDGATVHRGFYNAWKFSKPTIIAMLDALFYNHPTATLVITGHSLGGAVAHLATVDLFTATNIQMYDVMGLTFVKTHNQFDAAEDVAMLASVPHLAKSLPLSATQYKISTATYTFGQPRVGNNVFSNWVNAKLGNNQFYRVTHAKDMVPHVPPLALWATAQHVTAEVYFAADSWNAPAATCATKAEDSKCSNQHLLPTSIDNHLHYMGYYVATQETYC